MKSPKKTRIEDPEEILDRSIEAYFKRGEKEGLLLAQPSRLSCVVGRTYCYIRNGTDLLAKYDHRKRIFVEPTKKDLAE